MVVRKKFTTFVLFCSFIFSAHSLHAMIRDDLEDLGNGVYSGRSKTQKGEAIYYGCELVDSSNLENWRSYASHCKLMTEDSRGMMHVCSFVSNIRPLEFPYNYNINENTGLTEQEYIHYMDELRNKEAWKKEKAIRGVCAGVTAFSLSDNKNTYVTYASKKPIMGRFPFKTTEKFTLKDFNRVYDDLLMCVRTEFFSDLDPQPPYYKNRGIFKNPKAIIDGGYSNISLQLHGFSALVATHKFKDIKYMMVSPIPSMQKILVDNLKAGDAFIGYNNYAPYKNFPPLIHSISSDPNKRIAKECINTEDYKDIDLPKELVQYTGSFTTGEGGNETNNLIKIEALINIYRGTYKK